MSENFPCTGGVGIHTCLWPFWVLPWPCSDPQRMCRTRTEGRFESRVHVRGGGDVQRWRNPCLSDDLIRLSIASGGLAAVSLGRPAPSLHRPATERFPLSAMKLLSSSSRVRSSSALEAELGPCSGSHRAAICSFCSNSLESGQAHWNRSHHCIETAGGEASRYCTLFQRTTMATVHTPLNAVKESAPGRWIAAPVGPPTRIC